MRKCSPFKQLRAGLRSVETCAVTKDSLQTACGMFSIFVFWRLETQIFRFHASKESLIHSGGRCVPFCAAGVFRSKSVPSGILEKTKGCNENGMKMVSNEYGILCGFLLGTGSLQGLVL